MSREPLDCTAVSSYQRHETTQTSVMYHFRTYSRTSRHLTRRSFATSYCVNDISLILIDDNARPTEARKHERRQKYMYDTHHIRNCQEILCCQTYMYTIVLCRPTQSLFTAKCTTVDAKFENKGKRKTRQTVWASYKHWVDSGGWLIDWVRVNVQPNTL